MSDVPAGPGSDPRANLDPSLEAEVLRTERLELLPLPLEFCEAIVEGDRPSARRVLGLDLDEWPTGSEVDRAFPFYAARLREDPSTVAWQGRAIVVRESEEVAGSANFKGAPEDGLVEVGYQLVPRFRGNGYAREALLALVERAFEEPEIEEVVAVIHPDNAPSIAVAESVGLEHIGERSEVHPTSEVWAITRDAYEADAAG